MSQITQILCVKKITSVTNNMTEVLFFYTRIYNLRLSACIRV